MCRITTSFSDSNPGGPNPGDHAADPTGRRADVVLDVGDTLCGDLALMLRRELKKMAPGEVMKVIARDPAAPQDLPAWCGLTGHTMLAAEHPYYWIQRRND